MSIWSLVIAGCVFGFLVGISDAKRQVGCLILAAVPIGMIAYIGWWQAEHPENLRSTSGLDFVFGPLWPSLGALGGFFAGKLFRSYDEEP